MAVAAGSSGRATPPEVVALGRALLTDLDGLTDRLVADILGADPSYLTAGELPREDLRRSCYDNLQRILQTLTGAPGEREELDAPRATGRRRAEQGVPLESVLHAYRLGFRTIWEGMVVEARRGPSGVEALVSAATVVWELVDRFSSAVADAYRVTESDLARRDDRRRDALVDALIEGRGRERTLAADAAAALDLPEHGRFVVVVVDGTSHGRAARDALAARGLRSAWRTRADREIGLVHLSRSAPPDVVAALGRIALARAGVSPSVDGLAEVDLAARLAETALRALPPEGPCVEELDARLAAALLVTAPDLAGRVVRRALGGVLQLEQDERELLLATLTAWLDTGGSAGQTAARLYCHRNTVLNRLRRVESLTGRSLERVDHLVEWSLALLALDVLPDLA